MRVRNILLGSIISILMFGQSVLPCTALRLKDNDRIYVAKNYDWSVNTGIIIINKSSLAKTALAENNPARWVAKYGSVTFNQYGRENPNGGMNEAGLVVEVLWLRSTEYPSPDNRSTIGNLQWVQYQLDNCATVEDVIKTDSEIRIIDRAGATVHYFVADASGNIAVIEFLNGKMTVHTGENMPIPVITNNTYEESYNDAGQYKPFGGELIPGKRKTDIEIFSREASLDRFLHAALKAQEFTASTPQKDIEYIFNALHHVRSGDRTVWNIVYDIPNRAIYFQTIVEPSRKAIEFKSLEFDCNTPVFVIDINCEQADNIIERFEQYSYELNYEYLDKAIKSTGFLQDMPQQAIKTTALYPSLLKCLE